MKLRWIGGAVAGACLLVFSSGALAEEDSQLGEGTKQIIQSPKEVPEGTVEGAQEGAPVSGVIDGTAEGAGKAVEGSANVVEGTGEMVGNTLKGITGRK